MVNRLRKFLKHPEADRYLLVEAFAWLCWVKCLLCLVPFRWIAPRLGERMTESPTSITPPESALADRVSWAVQTAARQLGFVCLPQAVAAKWMLRRRRLPATLYLGLNRGEALKFSAHAWLRAGDQILTGKAEMRQHQVIATFS